MRKVLKPTANTERRHLPGKASVVRVEYRGEGDTKEPVAFVGKAIVCNSRSHNLGGFVEVIDPKALDDCDMSDVVGLFNHNRDLVLGRTTSGTLTLTRDSDGGLSYRIAYDPQDPDHQRVMAKIQRGDVVGSSFAFRVAPDGDKWDHEQTDTTDIYVRTVTKISKLGDVGPVTVPAYAASTAAKRSLDEARQQATPPGPKVPLSVRRRRLELAERAAA